MNITIHRHEEYNKFLVTVEEGYTVRTFTLYDMSIAELSEFVAGITKGE